MTEAGKRLAAMNSGDRWRIAQWWDDDAEWGIVPHITKIETEARAPLEARINRLTAALEWTLANLGGYAHGLDCSPTICVCGYWEARAALAAEEDNHD